MVWAVMSSKGLIAPFFRQQPISGQSKGFCSYSICLGGPLKHVIREGWYPATLNSWWVRFPGEYFDGCVISCVIVSIRLGHGLARYLPDLRHMPGLSQKFTNDRETRTVYVCWMWDNSGWTFAYSLRMLLRQMVVILTTSLFFTFPNSHFNIFTLFFSFPCSAASSVRDFLNNFLKISGIKFSICRRWMQQTVRLYRFPFFFNFIFNICHLISVYSV